MRPVHPAQDDCYNVDEAEEGRGGIGNNRLLVVVVVGGVKASPRGRDETEKETEIERERKTEKPKRS